MSPTLNGGGFAVTVPAGWDVRITGTAAGEYSRAEFPVLHAANFALPARRGDFGDGVVESMSTRQVFVALLGYGPSTTGSRGAPGLFAHLGLPRTLQPDWFGPTQMQRPIAGQAGLQRFFTDQARKFCLYAVVGSYRNRSGLVALINHFLAGATIQAEPSAAVAP